MTHGSLFTGIGGFDLGFEQAGIETIWQVEIDPFCRKVLEKHWPNVQRFADIRKCRDLPRVDIVSGGFPCQDISNAGLRAGIDGEQSGRWSEMFRVVREVRPGVVVVENVAALLGRGFGRVLGDLAACGYDCEWDCIPASAVGAPHRRDRVWIVAYTQKRGQRTDGRSSGNAGHVNERSTHPTPKSSPSGPDYARVKRPNSGGDDLVTAVARFRSPSSRDWKGMSAESWRLRTSGDITPTLPDQVGGALNPEWVAWLMGFPVEWLRLERSETRSFRRSRNGSGEES